MAEENAKEIGTITHFFDKISVAVVELTDKIKVGDKIRIKGNTTDFEQTVGEMQIEHEKVKEAHAGDAIGLKVKDRVRIHDKVYLI